MHCFRKNAKFEPRFLPFLQPRICLLLLLTVAMLIPQTALGQEKPIEFDSPPSDELQMLTPKPLPEKKKPKKDLSTITLYLENDVFVGEDMEYTNGLKLTWSSPVHKDYPPKAIPHRWLYPIIKKLPFKHDEHTRNNITYSIGQNIYTPEDIDKEELIEDDRPYAGITYVSIGFHNRTLKHMDTVELHAGLVGPESYAEECQEAVHSLFNDEDPEGWDNQLDNEAVLGIVYSHKKKIFESGIGRGFGYDGIINTGGALGNAMTFYNLGFTLRFGWNMPNDFGNFPIRPASAFNAAFDERDPRLTTDRFFGAHMFFSVNGKAVLRDIFLDGNTFSDSHDVDKELLVADYIAGVGFIMGRVKLSMAYVVRTEQFEEQDGSQEFGSINMSYSF